MALARPQLATNISDRLVELAQKVKVRSRANLTDANSAIEPIICRLFNALFGWQLINLNVERLNFPAADLGDRARKIAVQVTNEESSGKIAYTVQKAQEHNLGIEFDLLIVFFLLQRKPGLPKNFVQPPSGPKIEVWDITSILSKALEQDLESMQRASAFLDEELLTLNTPPSSSSTPTKTAKEEHRFDHGTYGLSNSPEFLYPSFFKVTYPPEIQQAKITLKRGVWFREKLASLWPTLKSNESPPVDFLIVNSVVYTFDSFELPIWKALISDAAIKPLPSFNSAVWADSAKHADRTHFIKLLKKNLEELCNRVGTAHKIAYSNDLRCHLFQAEEHKTNGTIKLPAIKKAGTREVFKAIKNTIPGREGEIQHWKHQAFRHRFMRFGGEWHGNIEPFGAFTGDGKSSQSRWHNTSSRNMKKPERNRAVLGHVMFWAALLCKETDMLSSLSSPISIQIHRPSGITTIPSIQDEAWKVIAPADEKSILTTDSQEELLIP